MGKYCMVPFKWGIESSQKLTKRQKVEHCGCQGLGNGRKGSYYLMSTNFQLGKMKKFWRLMMVMVAQQSGYLMPENSTLIND